MDPLAAQQSTMAAGDPPRATEQAERRCVLFGCVEEAAWIVSDPQDGELPACEADLDVSLNDALSRVPLDSSVRVEVGAHESPVSATAPVGAPGAGCG